MSDLSFEFTTDSTSTESESLIKIRVSTEYGFRIAAMFHMTKEQFKEFKDKGDCYFGLGKNEIPFGIKQEMKRQGWHLGEHDGLIHHPSGDTTFSNWIDALKACIEVAS